MHDAQQREIVMVADADALAAEAARRIVVAANSAIAARGRFSMALSGGSTPERTYKLLAQPDWRSRIDWMRTWLFFGDERCVPHNDSRSNYHLARESLLKPAKIAADRVEAVRTDLATPALCAADYELRLKRLFEEPNRQPARLDLILLGLGDDGHTASLFPGKPSLAETKAWVTWSPPGVLPPPVDRVTLTFPVINSAREAMFLVSGARKATIVHEVLKGRSDIEKLPSMGVRPINGKLVWLLDKPAASKLADP
ncbi:MAG: 6-phosphogluconolactonase [Pirellulales bacterium]|nr:6-phosphogluconolactonase [Pirellulales bacterium]